MFNVGGNKLRVIAAVHFNAGKVFVRHVLSHAEYGRGAVEAQRGCPMSSEVQAAIRYWPRVAPLLAPPRSKAAYRRLVDALDAVLDAGGADESHELARLADYLGDLVSEYEAAHLPIREMPVRAFLRELHEAARTDAEGPARDRGAERRERRAEWQASIECAADRAAVGALRTACRCIHDKGVMVSALASSQAGRCVSRVPRRATPFEIDACQWFGVGPV